MLRSLFPGSFLLSRGGLPYRDIQTQPIRTRIHHSMGLFRALLQTGRAIRRQFTY